MRALDPPLLRFLTFEGNHCQHRPRRPGSSSRAPPAAVYEIQVHATAEGPEHPSAAAPRAAGNRLMRSSERGARDPGVHVPRRGRAEAWMAATMLVAEAPVKKPRTRAARVRPHQLVRAAARLVRNKEL